MKKLFEQVELKNLKLKNRLVRSATWEGLALPDGGLTDEIYAIYEELAGGGVGGIITGFKGGHRGHRHHGHPRQFLL